MKGVNLEEELIKQFGEWGDLEHVRVIHSKNIGFVRYRLRAAAEFAKEAMADSSLGHEEVLTVRWANEDPNPALKASNQADNEAKAANAVLNKWGSTALWQYTMPTEQSYPDTDPQYAAKLAQFRAESELARQQLAARMGNAEDIDQAYAVAPTDGAPYDPTQYAAMFAAQHPELNYAPPADVAPEQEFAAHMGYAAPSAPAAAAAVPAAAPVQQKRPAEETVPTPGAGVSTKNIAALINARVKKAKAEASAPVPAAASGSSKTAATEEKK